MLAVAQHGLDPAEYNASTIKRTIGAWGRANKAQVARVVTMLLGHEVAGPQDVTDAIAIAMTHHNHTRMATLGAR